MVQRSRYGYTETLALVSKAILDAGNTIFATIDQSAAAQAAGARLRPTSLVVFGNPKGGTPLMEAYPLAALELPLKLLVWEDRGTVSVAYASMAEAAKRYGIPDGEPHVAAMDRALAAAAAAVA